jgi:hypothetical protein
MTEHAADGNAAFDASGRYLFLVDQAARLWRSVDGAAPSPVSGVVAAESVTCCRDGRIVVFTDAGPVAISPDTLDVLSLDRLKDQLTDGVFSENGRRFATYTGHTTVVGDENGTVLATLHTEGTVMTQAWSPDGRWLAFLSTRFVGESTYAWELMLVDADRSPLQATRIRQVTPPITGLRQRGVTWVAPDRLVVLDSNGPGNEVVWRWLAVAHDGAVNELGTTALGGRPLQPLATNGHRVVALEAHMEQRVCVADFDGSRMGPLQPQRAEVVSAVDWRSDHRLVASVRDEATKSVGLALLVPGESPTPLVNADPGEGLRTARIVSHTLYFLRFSQRRKTTLWAAGEDGANPHQVAETPDAMALACGGDVCALMSSQGDKREVRLFDPAKQALGPVLREAVHEAGIAVSSDGRYVAVGENTSIWVYDRRRNTSTVRKVKGLSLAQSIAFSGDDLLLTDPTFAPGSPALVRSKPNGDVEVLASDAEWYYEPAVDAVAHRLAVMRYQLHGGMYELDLPAPPAQ